MEALVTRGHESMYWFLWEAIVMQADDMFSKGIIGKELSEEVGLITRRTQELGVFSTKLRIMACEVEAKLIPFEAEWRVAVNKEEEELNNAIEVYERDRRLQQGVSEGSDLHSFGA